ncbi:MAG: response regulator [Rhodospirillaceae bacterium]|nr:response regulator [Rhodospirillaceae bacterium]MBT5779584.1 response regulator [Rhodospirillaceae bacterium]MBT7291123.1 response regulator [Rhodospirillaceae bacterium]
MKLLLIEDDFATASAVQAVLHAEGDKCDATQSGQRGVELALSGNYQAVILDLLLPELDGMGVLEQLRAANIKTPVLMLSGVGDVAKKIACFRAGADDYLVKPFESAELVARLAAIARRGSATATEIEAENADIIYPAALDAPAPMAAHSG